jgi:uncharacterized protein DUF6114
MNPKVSVAGMVLTIVGGLLVLAVGAYEYYVWSIISSLAGAYGVGSFLPNVGGFLLLGVVMGVLILLVGILAGVAPSLKIAWGALAIIFGIVSLFTLAFGGFFLGFILALVGGILIIIKKEPMAQPMMGAAPMMGSAPMGTPPAGGMRCAYCGGTVDPNTRVCTSCGKPAA